MSIHIHPLLRQKIKHPAIAAILAICFGLYFTQAAFPGEAMDATLRYSTHPADVVAAWQQLLNHGLSDLKALSALLHLVSALFLHAGAQHVFMNMIFFWIFGCLISEHIGRWRCVACFLTFGVIGNILFTYLNQQSNIPLLGASGAISGLEGLYLVLALNWRMDYPHVWPLAHPVAPSRLAVFAAVGFYIDIQSVGASYSSTAFAAHIGGFVSGIIFGVILTTLYPSLQQYNESRRSN